jgi:hypothetical protein
MFYSFDISDGLAGLRVHVPGGDPRVPRIAGNFA